jgi:hypothetical protein
MIYQWDHDFAAVVAIYRAGTVEDSDAGSHGKSGARPYLPLVARRDLNKNAGGDAAPFPGTNHQRFVDARPEIGAGRTGARKVWFESRMGTNTHPE